MMTSIPNNPIFSETSAYRKYKYDLAQIFDLKEGSLMKARLEMELIPLPSSMFASRKNELNVLMSLTIFFSFLQLYLIIKDILRMELRFNSLWK